MKVTRSWRCHASCRGSSRAPSPSRTSRPTTHRPWSTSRRFSFVQFQLLLPSPHPPSEGALMANVIALANQKGGVAKTTTTLNLGVALREQGNRVLVDRPRPAGKPHDEPGDEPRRDRALDVRRPRPSCPDLRRHPHRRGRHRGRLDRPGRARSSRSPRSSGGNGRSTRHSSKCATATTTSSSTRRRRSAC